MSRAVDLSGIGQWVAVLDEAGAVWLYRTVDNLSVRALPTTLADALRSSSDAVCTTRPGDGIECFDLEGEFLGAVFVRGLRDFDVSRRHVCAVGDGGGVCFRLFDRRDIDEDNAWLDDDAFTPRVVLELAGAERIAAGAQDRWWWLAGDEVLTGERQDDGTYAVNAETVPGVLSLEAGYEMACVRTAERGLCLGFDFYGWSADDPPEGWLGPTVPLGLDDPLSHLAPGGVDVCGVLDGTRTLRCSGFTPRVLDL